jgi:DNA-binding transcriptional MocR family regulator
MHMAALTRATIDCEAVSSALAGRGIQVHALDRYYHGPVPRSGFVLSYATADTAQLTAAVDALAEEIRSLDGQPRVKRVA